MHSSKMILQHRSAPKNRLLLLLLFLRQVSVAIACLTYTKLLAGLCTNERVTKMTISGPKYDNPGNNITLITLAVLMLRQTQTPIVCIHVTTVK